MVSCKKTCRYAPLGGKDPLWEANLKIERLQTGLANLKAILDDQPFGNSALSVFEIKMVLANDGGFMPDEAVLWFREGRGTFGNQVISDRNPQ